MDNEKTKKYKESIDAIVWDIIEEFGSNWSGLDEENIYEVQEYLSENLQIHVEDAYLLNMIKEMYDKGCALHL